MIYLAFREYKHISGNVVVCDRSFNMLVEDILPRFLKKRFIKRRFLMSPVLGAWCLDPGAWSFLPGPSAWACLYMQKLSSR